MELKRQMGFGSYQTAWSWLHKIRRAMVRRSGRRWRRGSRPTRPMSAARPGRSGRGAAGKTRVAGAVESGRGQARGRRLGRLRLAVVADVSARGLEGFLAANVARPATVATDGWSGYAGLGAKGYGHEPLNLSASWGDAALRLPAIHLVFGLAKRWLLGTHHGVVSKKHLRPISTSSSSASTAVPQDPQPPLRPRHPASRPDPPHPTAVSSHRLLLMVWRERMRRVDG